MTCERCGAETEGAICEDCYAEITLDPLELDDDAGDRDRERAADEVERS